MCMPTTPWLRSTRLTFRHPGILDASANGPRIVACSRVGWILLKNGGKSFSTFNKFQQIHFGKQQTDLIYSIDSNFSLSLLQINHILMDESCKHLPGVAGEHRSYIVNPSPQTAGGLSLSLMQLWQFVNGWSATRWRENLSSSTQSTNDEGVPQINGKWIWKILWLTRLIFKYYLSGAGIGVNFIAFLPTIKWSNRFWTGPLSLGQDFHGVSSYIFLTVESWFGHDMCGLLKAMLNVSYPSKNRILYATQYSISNENRWKIKMIQSPT